MHHNKCLDLAGKNTVLISGSGRSGTSWLANLCNAHNEFRYLFEPLNPDAKGGYKQRVQWAVNAESDAKQLDYLECMLLGKINSQWISSRNKKFIARRRLIKEIRSNLMLPWMVNTYPWLKAVWIIRNPMSVAASRKKLATLTKQNWVWKPSLEALLSEQEIIERLTSEQSKVLRSLIGQGVVKETIGDWSINNLLLRSDWQDLKTDNLYPVFYENLVSQAECEQEENEIAKLFDFLNIKFDQSIIKSAQKNSETSRRTVDEMKNKAMLYGWRSELSTHEQNEAMEVLEVMNIQALYPNASVEQLNSYSDVQASDKLWQGVHF